MSCAVLLEFRSFPSNCTHSGPRLPVTSKKSVHGLQHQLHGTARTKGPACILLGRSVYQLEAKGANTACGHQILSETKWLLSSTADFHRIDRRLDELQNVLDHPSLEGSAAQQDPNDGSWGRCYTEWFFKLDATYEHLNSDSTLDREPEFGLRFLDRVNSPAKLREYFAGLAVSKISLVGVNNRRALNESMADLMRLILHDQPAGYHWDPSLKKVLMDIILHQIRNPGTGWWGERYVFGDRTEFVDDLSLTFHIVRYLDGNVPDLSASSRLHSP